MIIGIDASRAFGNDKTGTENYSYHLITQILQLPESKKHQFVLFLRPNTTIPAWSEIVGSDYVGGNWPDNVQIRVIPWRYLWTQVGLAYATWQTNLDVLWVPAHTLPIFRKRRGLKTIVTIHGLEYEWLPEYKNILQKWYLPLSTMYAVKSADRLIAVSQFTQNQLIERLKADSKRIKVIHEGVEIGKSGRQSFGRSVSQKGRFVSMSANRRVLNKWGLREKGYILFVGTVQPRKNLPFLIEAYAQLPIDIRKQTRLVIAGSQGWMSEETYAAPGKYGVERGVVFTGRVDDISLVELYRGASIYVQPSITEGFGLPILEAMINGVPVVSSDGGALPEVVGQAGLVVPIELEKWVKALNRILTDSRLRERLSAAGKWRVKSMSWKNAAKETLLYLTNNST